MRSRLIGGLFAVALIAGAVTLSTANHANAADVAVHREVIQVSAPAPIALAPVMVSRAVSAHASVDVVLCIVAERGADSLTVPSDSMLGRLRVVIPRQYESSVAPPNPGSSQRSRVHRAASDTHDSTAAGSVIRSTARST
jgi:hypothetical protein